MIIPQVVSAIGAAESQPFDVGAPKRIDGDAAIRLVNVAAQSGVQQFTMVTALGTGKFGWPASEPLPSSIGLCCPWGCSSGRIFYLRTPDG